MKKLLAMILAMALIPAVVFAAIPDISGLTRDELIQLNHEIQTKLFSQQLVEGVRVPEGVYRIGEDIPAGTYRIEMAKGSDYDSAGLSAVNTKGEYTFISMLGFPGSTYEIGKLALNDGDTVTISGSLIFYAYSGLKFN